MSQHLDDLVATAIGGAHRRDPVAPRTGGPAGNARLTAWVGLALLLLFAVEGVTLLRLHQLIDVHLVVGGVLVPLTFAKTATTGWRILRYYTGDRDYVAAGPPPLILRMLGPLVVLTALAVLGTGLALIPLGVDGTHAVLFTVGGFTVSPITLHQAAFIAWLAVTALHVLARTIPAVKLTVGGFHPGVVPGRSLRLLALVVTAGLGAAAAVVVLHYGGAWTHGGGR